MKVEELVKKLDASIEISKNLTRKVERLEEKFENRIPFPDL